MRFPDGSGCSGDVSVKSGGRGRRSRIQRAAFRNTVDENRAMLLSPSSGRPGTNAGTGVERSAIQTAPSGPLSAAVNPGGNDGAPLIPLRSATSRFRPVTNGLVSRNVVTGWAGPGAGLWADPT